MILTYKKKYLKKYDRLSEKTKLKVADKLEIFIVNPFDKILHNHALLGDYAGYRSINVTGDYRIIFRELSDGTYELVELVDVETHSQLY